MSQTLESKVAPAVQVPEQGTWDIDASHSDVSFVIRHLMVSKVRGGFGSFRGEITIGATPEESKVEVEIDAASINTHDEKRDGHLRTPDFLDIEQYPTLTFRSTGFQRTGESTFDLPGELTIRGITRPVVLQAEYAGSTVGMSGAPHAAFSASTEIDREAFGLTWNMALESGGVLLGKKVKIELEVAAVRRS